MFVATVLTVRAGKLIGVQNFSCRDNSPAELNEKLDEFISQYYLENVAPEEVLTPTGLRSGDCFETRNKSFTQPPLTAPKIGYKKKLLEMAEQNAREYLETSIEKIKHRDDFTVGACDELAKVLGLETKLKRIECYDISHLGGEDTVASMVVFVDGAEDKKAYRKFRVRTSTNDDLVSMREVLTRRLARTDWTMPDLIVLDGGKAQLSVASTLATAELVLPACAGTSSNKSSSLRVSAKDNCATPYYIAFGGVNDEIFTDKGVIRLPKNSYALRLLTRIRDEAHRFANYYRKNLRKKKQ